MLSSYPCFFYICSPKGGPKDHELVDKKIDKFKCGPPDMKGCELTLLSWNEPHERKEQHSAPSLMAVPKLGGGKDLSQCP